MAIQKLNFPIKVTNGGATPSGILTSAEFNRIPSKIDEIIDALGQKQPVTWSDIENKPTTFLPSAHTHTTNDITDLNTWINGKKFLTSVSWDDLIGTVPTFNQDTTGTAAAADSVIDYNLDANRIKIGYYDDPLTMDELKQFAGYTLINGYPHIKDISKDTAMRVIQAEAYGSGTWGINAWTANALHTARSLWGNNFSGAGDVNGDIRFGMEGEEGAERHIFFGANIAENAGFHFNANGWGVYDWLNEKGVIRYYSKNPNQGFDQGVLYSGVTWSLLNGELQIGDYVLTAKSNGLQLSQANGAAANLIATAFYESSDRRLKKDVKEIDDLEIADKIKFREFRFLSNDERLRYGVIAQELEVVGLNQLVSDGEFKSVDYISMLCLKMAAMEKKITSLTQEIERLKHE